MKSTFSLIFRKYFDGKVPVLETPELERCCTYKNCQGKLIVVEGNEPYSGKHLQCEECDSTYEFNLKQKGNS